MSGKGQDSEVSLLLTKFSMEVGTADAILLNLHLQNFLRWSHFRQSAFWNDPSPMRVTGPILKGLEKKKKNNIIGSPVQVNPFLEETLIFWRIGLAHVWTRVLDQPRFEFLLNHFFLGTQLHQILIGHIELLELTLLTRKIRCLGSKGPSDRVRN